MDEELKNYIQQKMEALIQKKFRDKEVFDEILN